MAIFYNILAKHSICTINNGKCTYNGRVIIYTHTHNKVYAVSSAWVYGGHNGDNGHGEPERYNIIALNETSYKGHTVLCVPTEVALI